MDKIIGITKNSKEVKPGYAYFCFEGNAFSGYDFIEEAIANGAVKIVGQKDIKLDIYEKVTDVNTAMVEYGKKIYDNPQDEFRLIGVTGTDGKTSTAILIDNIINQLSSSAYLGTSGFWVKRNEIEYTDFTTPFADKLFKYFNITKNHKVKNFVMEVSSHALEQKRLGDIELDVAIFTNLSSEHLDFHKTLENYFEAKKKIFSMLKSSGYGIINSDDKYASKIKSVIKTNKLYTISTMDQGADYFISNIILGINGTEFDLIVKDVTYKIKTLLLAKFNVYNLVEAIACVHQLGYKINDIIACVGNITVPGRLEVISKNDRTVIIDFAHTPKAIAKVMSFINDLNHGQKVWVITGSAGGRDHQKRAKMGEYAAQYADYLILTEDDPRSEDVNEISKQIKLGIKNKKCQISEITNRKEAIKYALENSNPNDVIVLFGKGTMKYMYYDGYKESYNEKKTVLDS